LFSGLFARGGVAAAVSDRAFLRAMLDFEVALVRALVHAGLAPADAAEELAAVADADAFDLDELGRSTGEKGTPVPGLLSALKERLGDSDAAAHLHRGATSQDVVDTAAMLVARRALEPLLGDLEDAADACAGFAERHRSSLQAGRTLLQHALPVTFGLKAAVWLSALDGARSRLGEVRDHELAVQLGGAVGTLAVFGDRGLEIMADVCAQLELAEPQITWHTVRLRPARLACELGITLGALGKIARDVILLAQTEVGEVSEGGAPGRGGSSTMPHKRNPVGAVAVLACVQRAPGLVATILSSMTQEHERAAGGWQAEWETLLELLQLTGSAAAAMRELLDGLEIHPERMRTNLDATGGLVMSEAVATVLAESIGRPRAQELVEEAARRAARGGGSFREALLGLPEVTGAIDERRLDEALAPERYLGIADDLIERALAAHRGSAEPH
jgi:3-carboxy-cis,cis-muconate cycloisomerase